MNRYKQYTLQKRFCLCEYDVKGKSYIGRIVLLHTTTRAGIVCSHSLIGHCGSKKLLLDIYKSVALLFDNSNCGDMLATTTQFGTCMRCSCGKVPN